MTAEQVIIKRLESPSARDVSDLISSIILPLAYYNERGKAEEISKYTPTRLAERIAADPDSVLVAYKGSRPVGFCISRYDDGLIWLAWFGVDLMFRGLGLGIQLLQALASTLKGRRAHKIWCDTRTENQRSQRVLQKFGFRQVAELNNHWYGQDFFIWEWLP